MCVSDKSKISWCDATWNPTRGCTQVSAGCKNCYAERFAERFRGVKGHPFEQGFDVRLVPEALNLPLHWKKPRRIFVNSMSDLFHPEVPFEFIRRVFGVIETAPQHAYLILTKRPERMRDYDRWASDHGVSVAVPSSVWLGVSAENQETADERIPILLDTPAANRFVSAEPLLGPLHFGSALEVYAHRGSPCCIEKEGWHRFGEEQGHPVAPKIDWVIVGGESGPGARPYDLAWPRAIIAQCRAAGVPCFHKQIGANPVRDSPSDVVYFRGKWDREHEFFAHTKHPAGADPSEWPEDLRVQQFPEEMPR